MQPGPKNINTLSGLVICLRTFKLEYFNYILAFTASLFPLRSKPVSACFFMPSASNYIPLRFISKHLPETQDHILLVASLFLYLRFASCRPYLRSCPGPLLFVKPRSLRSSYLFCLGSKDHFTSFRSVFFKSKWFGFIPDITFRRLLLHDWKEETLSRPFS